jgi:hypothetical protein
MQRMTLERHTGTPIGVMQVKAILRVRNTALMTVTTAFVLMVLSSIVHSTEAWSMTQQNRQDNSRQTPFCASSTEPHTPQLVESIHRRNFLCSVVGTVVVAAAAAPRTVQAVSGTTTNPKVNGAIAELKESRDKLKEIPDLLEAKEWDKVRSILKVPPVNKLWNLGDVRNFYGFETNIDAQVSEQNLTVVLPLYVLKTVNECYGVEYLSRYCIYMYKCSKVTKYSVGIGQRNGKY